MKADNAPNELLLDETFWNTRWENHETGWDIGYASPAITEFFVGFSNRDAAILIPGCGNAYEAEYLLKNGFTDITLIDIAPKAVEQLRQKFADSPHISIICEDFFEHQGQYDIIVEQTFFCAISPELRDLYVTKTYGLLKDGGFITGVLFNKDFGFPFPPFGGSREEYQERFSPYYDIRIMEDCYNSIPPRAHTELFIYLKKKATL